jgi:hypothetical protein
LSEYIDWTVSAAEKTEIESHLKTCEKCSNALTELKKTIEHVKSVDEIEPPAWITQKIMAKVRAEAEEKKTIFQRLFFPLAVKLPVQVVAVLFLTITAYYVYQNINPADRYAEAPRVATAKKEVSAPAPGKDKGAPVPKKDTLDKMQSSTQRSKQVPQAPEYKALDMKQEYEKPAPPTLEGKAATSAPAIPAERQMLSTKDTAMGKQAVAPHAPAPAMMQEQAVSRREESAGVIRHRELKHKGADAFREPSFIDFVRSIKAFPYKAPSVKRGLILKEYKELFIGMNKQEVIAIIGSPDYADTYRHKGSYWAYVLSMRAPKFIDPLTDQYLFIFFELEGKTYWIVPNNIQSVEQKGKPPIEKN